MRRLGKIAPRNRSRLIAASMLILVLAFSSSQLSRPARAATTNATFVGTSYINEHFRMEITPQFAVLKDLSVGNVLVQRMYWSVQVRSELQWMTLPNGTLAPNLTPPVWLDMNWTSAPSLEQEQVGDYHRVVISGILDGRLAVSIFFDGLSIDVPNAGPKITVALQSTVGSGTFRVQWHFATISANSFNLELRTTSNRQIIYGPISQLSSANPPPAGENSLVALASDGSTILFGANWQDALQYYQGTSVFASVKGASVSMLFGQFPLIQGQSVVIDPVVEGGGGGGGGTPSVTIYGVASAANSLNGNTATVTWSTYPSSACDQFSWGTTTSYGNTIYPSCGTHSVSLSGLSRHVTYYYRITSSASGYYSTTFSSAFYPTDISESPADELYTLTSGSSASCGGNGFAPVSVTYKVESEMPGDLIYNPQTVGNPNSYQVWDLYGHYDATGNNPWPCFDTLGTARTHVDIWVYDYPTQTYDWTAPSGNLIGYTSATGSGTNSWSFSGGINAGPFSFSAGYGYTPYTGTNVLYGFYQPPFPIVNGGWAYLGGVDYTWPTQSTVQANFIVPMKVLDSLAQYRFLDQVTVRVGFTNWYQWFWQGGWEGGTAAMGAWSIYLGDGDLNWPRITDTFTDVQQGTMQQTLT